MSNVKAEDKAYIAGTYGRFDTVLVKGSGCVYTDEEGRRCIDLGSGIGVNCFGACDPQWVAAIEKQLHTMGHVSNLYYSAPQAELARILCERTGMKKVFFGNSGAEANECALKVARKYGEKDGRHVIVTLINSFHGRTIATLAATGQDRFHAHFGPFPEGFRYVPANDCEALKAALDQGDVCAVLMEMVQGEGGVCDLDKSFVQYAAKLCAEKDALMMVDEVQTGNGRTGKLYAWMHFGIQPDVFTTAKGLAGGLPMGACVLGEKAEFVLGKGDHGSTFGGNPLSAAGGVHVMSRLTDELFDEVTRKGNYLKEKLSAMKGVKSVTGMGLMLGVLTDRPAGELAADCLKHGLMVLTAHEKIRLLPPLTITMEELDEALAIFEKLL